MKGEDAGPLQQRQQSGHHSPERGVQVRRNTPAQCVKALAPTQFAEALFLGDDVVAPTGFLTPRARGQRRRLPAVPRPARNSEWTNAFPHVRSVSSLGHYRFATNRRLPEWGQDENKLVIEGGKKAPHSVLETDMNAFPARKSTRRIPRRLLAKTWEQKDDEPRSSVQPSSRRLQDISSPLGQQLSCEDLEDDFIQSGTDMIGSDPSSLSPTLLRPAKVNSPAARVVKTFSDRKSIRIVRDPNGFIRFCTMPAGQEHLEGGSASAGIPHGAGPGVTSPECVHDAPIFEHIAVHGNLRETAEDLLQLDIDFSNASSVLPTDIGERGKRLRQVLATPSDSRTQELCRQLCVLMSDFCIPDKKNPEGLVLGMGKAELLDCMKKATLICVNKGQHFQPQVPMLVIGGGVMQVADEDTPRQSVTVGGVIGEEVLHQPLVMLKNRLTARSLRKAVDAAQLVPRCLDVATQARTPVTSFDLVAFHGSSPNTTTSNSKPALHLDQLLLAFTKMGVPYSKTELAGEVSKALGRPLDSSNVLSKQDFQRLFSYMERSDVDMGCQLTETDDKGRHKASPYFVAANESGAEMVAFDVLTTAQGMLNQNLTIVTGRISDFLRRKSQIFAGTSASIISAVARIAHLRCIRRGTMLLQRGQPMSHLFILISGNVELSATRMPADDKSAAKFPLEDGSKQDTAESTKLIRRRRTGDCCNNALDVPVPLAILSEGEALGWDGRLSAGEEQALLAGKFVLQNQLTSDENALADSATVTYLAIPVSGILRVLPLTLVINIRKRLLGRRHVHQRTRTLGSPAGARRTSAMQGLARQEPSSHQPSGLGHGDTCINTLNLATAAAAAVVQSGTASTIQAGRANERDGEGVRAVRPKVMVEHEETFPDRKGESRPDSVCELTEAGKAKEEELRIKLERENARQTALAHHMRFIETFEAQQNSLALEERQARVTREFNAMLAALQQQEDLTRPRLAKAQEELRRFRQRYPDSSGELKLVRMEQRREYHLLVEGVRQEDMALNRLTPLVKNFGALVQMREKGQVGQRNAQQAVTQEAVKQLEAILDDAKVLGVVPSNMPQCKSSFSGRETASPTAGASSIAGIDSDEALSWRRLQVEKLNELAHVIKLSSQHQRKLLESDDSWESTLALHRWLASQMSPASTDSSESPGLPPGVLTLTVMCARNLMAMDGGVSSDPYIRLRLANDTEGEYTNTRQTHVIRKTLNPQWNESFSYKLDREQRQWRLIVECLDWDRGGGEGDSLGTCELPLRDLTTDKGGPVWHKLEQRGATQNQGEVQLRYSFEPSGFGVWHRPRVVTNNNLLLRKPVPASQGKPPSRQGPAEQLEAERLVCENDSYDESRRFRPAQECISQCKFGRLDHVECSCMCL